MQIGLCAKGERRSRGRKVNTSKRKQREGRKKALGVNIKQYAATRQTLYWLPISCIPEPGFWGKERRDYTAGRRGAHFTPSICLNANSSSSTREVLRPWPSIFSLPHVGTKLNWIEKRMHGNRAQWIRFHQSQLNSQQMVRGRANKPTRPDETRVNEKVT